MWKVFPGKTFTVMMYNWPAVRVLSKHGKVLDVIVNKCLVWDVSLSLATA